MKLVEKSRLKAFKVDKILLENLFKNYIRRIYTSNLGYKSVIRLRHLSSITDIYPAFSAVFNLY
jgi:hypothetical protein